MKCHTCGANLGRVITSLPFKLKGNSIVILKDLPVLQCENCTEYLLEDHVMASVDRMLEGVDGKAELEVLQYAA